jgi:hypothetical protein
MLPGRRLCGASRRPSHSWREQSCATEIAIPFNRPLQHEIGPSAVGKHFRIVRIDRKRGAQVAHRLLRPVGL